MNPSSALLIGGALALWLLSRRAPAPAPQEDRAWLPALLTEYHPDAPPSERRMEGGPYDRNPREKTLVITVQQHRQDPARYPYVSVAGDLTLRGVPVAYGTRIYFGAYPDLIFRLVDTGQHFTGTTKVIRQPGHEPFDIATSHGSKLGFSGKKTVYWIDRNDRLPVRHTPRVA